MALHKKKNWGETSVKNNNAKNVARPSYVQFGAIRILHIFLKSLESKWVNTKHQHGEHTNALCKCGLVLLHKYHLDFRQKIFFFRFTKCACKRLWRDVWRAN